MVQRYYMNLLKLLNERARKEGIDARMFNTADTLNAKMDMYADFADKSADI